MSKIVKMADDNCMLNEEVMSLQNITLQYICNHLDIISSEDNSLHMNRFLHEDIILPSVLCDRLLESYQHFHRNVGDRIINLFRDNTKTSLNTVRLRNSFITNYG